MKKGLLLLAVLVCSTAAYTQTKQNTRLKPASLQNTPVAAITLPIRRVILYSNGVAYIERRGFISGNSEVNLSFKQSQVDDVLKSMLVLDLGQGKIGAVSYNSSAPPSARMAEIPFSVDALTSDGNGIAGVLGQLQGTNVSVVSTKGSSIGSILTVERKQIKGEEKETRWTNVLVIVSANGEISNFDLNDIRSLKILDEDTRKDLSEFASATASTRRRDAKTITVTSEGSGQRELIVSYVIAAPIWKTTYRVVLDEDGKPFFQGWAIVDNVSDDDWINVRLSLVSGSPISFIQNLQKPFYRYRPVIPMPQDLQLQPQIYEQGGAIVSSISGSVVDSNGAVIPNASITLSNNSTGKKYSLKTNDSGNFTQSGLVNGTYNISAYANGFQNMNIRNASVGSNLRIELQIGSVSSTVDVSAGDLETLPSTSNGVSFSKLLSLQPGGVNSSNSFLNEGAEVSASKALIAGNSGVATAATGEEIGDLFEYRIERPITVMRDHSALIPIVQTKMDGERVAVYNESVRRDRPFSGVLLKNQTNLTLESGSLTVIDGNAYAGEALMERLKPKDERLISFALDLGTLIKVREDDDSEPAKLIKVVDGVFQVHYFQTERKTYQISNQNDRPKIVYIEFPIRSGWVLSEDTPKPDYSTQNYYRFRIELKPNAETEFKITERQPLMDSYQLTSLTTADLNLFVSRNYIDSATRIRLEKLIDLRAKMVQIDNKINALRTEEQQIANDQRRLRENIEALSKTPEAKALITRYIGKANDQESRLEEITKERKTFMDERESLQRSLAAEIKNFNIQ